MKPITVKTDDTLGWGDPVETIFKVGARKGSTLVSLRAPHPAAVTPLSTTEARRLIDALTVAVETVEAEGRSS